MNADMSLSWSELLTIACAAVAESKDLAANPPDSFDVDIKTHRNDVVTDIDKEIENHLSAFLTEKTGYPVLGEEGHTIENFSGRVWVLDPIDGTLNFVETHRDFAISLALCEDGVPVIGVVCDVMASHLYTAIRGQGAFCDGVSLAAVAHKNRNDIVYITDIKELVALPRLMRIVQQSRGHRRYGSAALECVEVAAGRAGAFVHMWVSPWDIAAALVICHECGVKVARIDGTPLDVRYKGSIVAAAEPAHGQIIDALMTAANEEEDQFASMRSVRTGPVE